MALNSLICADMPLSNYSLTPTLTRWLQHRYKQSRLCVREQWPH